LGGTGVAVAGGGAGGCVAAGGFVAVGGTGVAVGVPPHAPRIMLSTTIRLRKAHLLETDILLLLTNS
jgi:hypothetical protein